MGDEVIEAADQFHVLGRDADFLLSFADGGRLERLLRLDRTAREGDLSAVGLELVAAAGEEDRPLAGTIADERDQHAGPAKLGSNDLHRGTRGQDAAELHQRGVVKPRHGVVVPSRNSWSMSPLRGSPCAIGVPNADALGYVDCAAPRRREVWTLQVGI